MLGGVAEQHGSGDNFTYNKMHSIMFPAGKVFQCVTIAPPDFCTQSCLHMLADPSQRSWPLRSGLSYLSLMVDCVIRSLHLKPVPYLKLPMIAMVVPQHWRPLRY